MADSRVVLVTGSSRGIGAGLVTGFAKKDFRVVINYSKSAEVANALSREILAGAGQDSVMVIKCDVSKRQSVRDMFDSIIAKFGRVDVLVNNAGLNLDGPFLEMTDERWQRVIDINLTGNFICSQEFAFHFKGDVGHIINIASSTGFRGRKNGANYCASKAGVINLTKCLALELAPKIRVNCIVPGFVETEEVMTRYDLHRKENYDAAVASIPLARMGTPDDIFRMADFIVENSAHITGQNFFVNGGDYMY
jgi:NAD(P)-dependent dehydrogenase (short-subunit alcohol dehydrogenase family)